LTLDILYVVFLTFSAIYLCTLLAASIFLLYRGYQTRLYNLIFLSLSYLSAAISQIGSVLLDISLLLEIIILSLSFIFLVIFTNLTFHEDHKPFTSRLILIITLINYFIQVYLAYLVWIGTTTLVFFVYTLHMFFERFIVFYWYGWSSYRTYIKLRSPNIEPWIIVRYKLISITAALFIIQSFILFFQFWNISFGDPDGLQSDIIFGSSSIIVIIASIGVILAWFMPNWFKSYLSKDYEPLIDKEYSEGEISGIINYLAEFLSKEIDISIPAARGMIKLAIQEEFNPLQYSRPLNYGNLKDIIHNSLKERIKKLNIENIEVIILNLSNHLIEGQSLVTMAII